MGNNSIAVIGFGYIGSVIGAVLADKGCNIIGVDTNQTNVDLFAQGHTPFAEPGLDDLIKKAFKKKLLHIYTDPSVIIQCDVVIITVGTPLDNKNEPDLSQIITAAEMINPYIKKGALVILKSTVPPNTTKEVLGNILKGKEVDIAFCPERIAEGRAIREFRTIPVVAGGLTESATRRAASFWHKKLGVKVIEVSSASTAEMVKLADNLWIDLNIAIANELAMISDKLGIDVLEVIEAANSLPKGQGNVNILNPSVGVGGYCLTKDPWFVHQLGKSLGIELIVPFASRTINDYMPVYSSNIICSFLSERDAKVEDLKVAILGIAFKNNTGDCRFTPTKTVIEKLEKYGCNIEICDPWVKDIDKGSVTALPVSNDIERTIKDADCVAFLAGHREFHNIPIKKIAELAKQGAMVFDGRMFFSKDKIKEMKAYGLIYKGVGR